MSKLNGTKVRILVNGEPIRYEVCHYFSDDKVTIMCYEDTEIKQFETWRKEIGNQFTLSINEDWLKASEKMTLSRVGVMIKMENVIRTSLVFKK